MMIVFSAVLVLINLTGLLFSHYRKLYVPFYFWCFSFVVGVMGLGFAILNHEKVDNCRAISVVMIDANHLQTRKYS